MTEFHPIVVIVLGATVLSVAGIASGGTFLLRVLSGRQGANELQKAFFRAGHAHAGVLVTLGLTLAVLGRVADASPAWSEAGPIAVLTAAIFVPAAFFLSVLGTDPRRPNRLFGLIWIGVAALVFGVICSGVALVAAGVAAL